MMMPVAVMARRCRNHMKGSPEVRTHIGDQAAALTAAVGSLSSETILREGPRQAHVQWQQTCGVGVRRRTIASGSCCSPLGGSRSCSECRTESLAATAHAMAARRGSVTVAFALVRVS